MDAMQLDDSAVVSSPASNFSPPAASGTPTSTDEDVIVDDLPLANEIVLQPGQYLPLS